MVSISIPIAAAGIAAAGSIGGALISSSASKSAAKTQATAADNATATQLKMYEQTRSDLLPYNQAGQSAIAQLARLFGLGPNGTAGTGPSDASAAAAFDALAKYPGYQFQLNQGQQALDRSAASKGLLLSGAQIKDSQAFGQGLAQSAYTSYLSGLQGLGTLGENAAAMTGTAATATGQGVAQSQLAAGQATAAGQVGSANAWSNGIQGALNNSLSAYQAFSQPAVGSLSNLSLGNLPSGGQYWPI